MASTEKSALSTQPTVLATLRPVQMFQVPPRHFYPPESP